MLGSDSFYYEIEGLPDVSDENVDEENFEDENDDDDTENNSSRQMKVQFSCDPIKVS